MHYKTLHSLHIYSVHFQPPIPPPKVVLFEILPRLASSLPSRFEWFGSRKGFTTKTHQGISRPKSLATCNVRNLGQSCASFLRSWWTSSEWRAVLGSRDAAMCLAYGSMRHSGSLLTTNTHRKAKRTLFATCDDLFELGENKSSRKFMQTTLKSITVRTFKNPSRMIHH